ncbi:MAG: GFA family protein [Pseudomonadota bacterium]
MSQVIAERARPRATLFHGACACGTVRFRASVDVEQTAACICAKCRGAGLVIAYAEDATFRLLTGREALTEPPEEARTPHHFFCGRCGEAVFGHIDRAGHPRMVSVNTACLRRGAAEDLVDPPVRSP